MRRRVVLIGVLIVAVGGAAATALTTTDRSESPAARDGTSDESLGSVDGISFDGFGTSKKVELNALRGKPLVLNYWASWCLFCIEEMPDFQKVYGNVSDRVEFLGVNIRDDVDAAKELAKATGVRYPLAADPKGDAYRRLRGFAMPTTWFIDEEGRIVERFSGPLTAEQLGERIRKHFGT